MAQTTPNYGLTIAEGTDTVNLLTQCYPNFSTLDTVVKGIADTGVTTASETKSGTVHQLVRSNPDCNIFRFTATSNFVTGDTFTVDGSPVTAVSVSGTSLATGDFVINSNVLAIVNGGVLTILIGGSSPAPTANDVSYDNTVSGLAATDVQDAIDELAARPTTADASDVTYDNTLSGLTATDVQAAIDELKALIPVISPYITTGLTIPLNNCTINAGGYYVDDNNICHVDITITVSTNLAAGNFLIKGFPQAATPVPGSGTTPVTAEFNDAYIGQHSANLTSMLVGSSAISSGSSVHFIGSYSIL